MELNNKNPKGWPVYKKHCEARCWQCHGLMDGVTMMDAGFPDGDGRYKQWCSDCEKLTFYDIEKASK